MSVNISIDNVAVVVRPDNLLSRALSNVKSPFVITQ